MDHNQIIVKVPKGGSKKKNSPTRKGKSDSEGRTFSKFGKKDKDRLRIEKSSSRNKSPNRRPQKENLKKDLRTLLNAANAKEEKKEINQVLKDDDADKLEPYEAKLKRAKSATNLEKRTLDTFLNQGKTFLKFDGDDEDEQANEKKKDDLESIDNMFGELKKVKRDSTDKKEIKRDYQDKKEAREPTSEKRNIQLRSAGPSLEELEKANAPWMSGSTSKIENPLIRLHNEIIDFVEFVGPSKKEEATRRKSFDKLAAIIIEIFPQATVKPFGSFVTNLYLPQSDIDVAVIEPTLGAQQLLNKIAKAFMKNGDYENINVIKSAKVPLVKVVESSTGINFDISFNKLDGINQVQEIQRALDYYPEMRYMILVIKCFLKQRDLNETYQGGIGSFLLFCLVLTFLREMRKDYVHDNREDDVDRILLSEFILKFFDYFANFDYFRKQIMVSGGGAVVNKYMKAYGLSVMSPQDSNHDIGAAVFRVREVFNIFKNRVHFLTNYNFQRGESVLKYLVDSRYLS